MHTMKKNLEGDDKRTVLRFHPALAPIKAAILPLSKKLSEGAEQCMLQTYVNTS